MSRRFQPGNPGGPGRPQGSRNKLSEAFLDALYRDFQVNGVDAVASARAESPLGYVRLIASLLPQRLEIERLAPAMTDDELLQVLRGSTSAPTLLEHAMADANGVRE
jgi:hypothetical protein